LLILATVPLLTVCVFLTDIVTWNRKLVAWLVVIVQHILVFTGIAFDRVADALASGSHTADDVLGFDEKVNKRACGVVGSWGFTCGFGEVFLADWPYDRDALAGYALVTLLASDSGTGYRLDLIAGGVIIVHNISLLTCVTFHWEIDQIAL
jgi:hypothetical protein